MVVELCGVFRMEGGEMMLRIIFVSLIGGIIVGVILRLFSYWVNKRGR